jgi:hypothetical protein
MKISTGLMVYVIIIGSAIVLRKLNEMSIL